MNTFQVTQINCLLRWWLAQVNAVQWQDSLQESSVLWVEEYQKESIIYVEDWRSANKLSVIVCCFFTPTSHHPTSTLREFGRDSGGQLQSQRDLLSVQMTFILLKVIVVLFFYFKMGSYVQFSAMLSSMVTAAVDATWFKILLALAVLTPKMAWGTWG